MAGDLDAKLIAAVDRLSRALRVARQDVATRHNLSLLQLQLLEHLAASGRRRVGELAAEFDVRQPTISDALTALEDKGLAERGPDPTDRRATAVTLTPAGADLGARIAAELRPLLAADRTTSETDRGTALHVVLDEIRRLQKEGVITVNRSCLSCRYYQPPGETSIAHCGLLDEPLRRQDLRVDCPEHRAQDPRT